ncbi:aldo/keto reductase [uncultured Agrococcus sp.]|uniref:aldo/keto reductase n=1 Tax=uncultured Agrococcus sp. TaxID=382258 RepID=UPI0025FDA861|nr:aldo/keto reductase [uncultured Agrococcus sp.]
MERTLGSSGITVSAVGLGCNNFGRKGTLTEGLAGTRRVLDAAIDHGITFLDTADMYGVPPTTSETLMGEALKGKRDEVVLATKWGHSAFPIPGTEAWGPKGAEGYIRRAVDDSLQRLQTDFIDLYQLHTPDPDTPIADTIAVLDDLVRAGKIRTYGHSNFSAAQIREAEAVETPNGFVTAQNEYSLLQREAEQEVLPAAAAAGLGFLPYFPLANGLLTGKYSRDERPSGSRLTDLKPQLLEDANWDALERYRAAVESWGITMLEATFGWLLGQRPVISVIAGATREEQIAGNAAAGRTELSDEQLEEISRIFA